ncbi:ABC transporter permease [Microbacterium sp. R86528]|uniref:ABC transporter permease n=1 Tax=Microbacterium sp. R86528 TaxID=3093864 RepID=UPI0037C5A5BD
MSVPASGETGSAMASRSALFRERQRATPKLIGLRLLQIPAVLCVVSIIVFALIEVVPGDPGRNALGQYATAEQVAQWNASHNLDGALIERYIAWTGGLLTGDWGISLVYDERVLDLVFGRLSNSMMLGLYAFLMLVPIAIGLGVAQARREGSRSDRALTIVLMSLAAVPEFVIGVLLLIVFGLALPILPINSGDALGQGLPAQLRAMTLPAITIALGSLAVFARMTRNAVIETTGSQFYRTAVVKGVDGSALLRRHVARNSMIPVVSLLGIYLGAMLCGSAVVETLFSYPGLGALLVTATQQKDIFVLTAGVMITAVISMLALLATDVVFTMIDPRVRFSGGS